MTHCHCEIKQVVHVLDLMAKFMCKMEAHMADFSALKAVVEDVKVTVDATVVKIDELKAAIPADQQPEVDAIVADVQAKLDQLKAAIA